MCFTACGGDDNENNDKGSVSGNPIDLVTKGDINLSYLSGTWNRNYFAYYVNNQFHHGGLYDESDNSQYTFGPGESAVYYFKNSKGSNTYVADRYYIDNKNGKSRIYLEKDERSSYVGDIYALTENKLVLEHENGEEKTLYLYIKKNN